LPQLVDMGFHTYIEYFIKKDPVVSARIEIAELYGAYVVPHVIK